MKSQISEELSVSVWQIQMAPHNLVFSSVKGRVTDMHADPSDSLLLLCRQHPASGLPFIARSYKLPCSFPYTEVDGLGTCSWRSCLNVEKE